MITIGKVQSAALDVSFAKQQRTGFAARLHADPAIKLPPLSPEELDIQVAEGCEAAEELRFTEPEHVYRFLRLRYAPESVWERPGLQELMTRVLCEPYTEAEVRLSFVEKNIAFRH